MIHHRQQSGAKFEKTQGDLKTAVSMNRNLTTYAFRPVKLLGTVITFIGLFASMSQLKADDATNVPPKSHWESVASADLTMTRGNSHTFLGAITINSTRKSEKDEFLSGGRA